MSYKTQLRGQLNLGGAAFDLQADLRGDQGIALAGSNTSHMSFRNDVSNVLKLSGSLVQLPPDFPDLTFEKNALQMTVAPGNVSLSGTSSPDWKNPFGVLKGLTLRTFHLRYSSADPTLSFPFYAESPGLRPTRPPVVPGAKTPVPLFSL